MNLDVVDLVIKVKTDKKCKITGAPKIDFEYQKMTYGIKNELCPLH